jgi:hypothetical protein
MHLWVLAIVFPATGLPILLIGLIEAMKPYRDSAWFAIIALAAGWSLIGLPFCLALRAK